MNVQNGFITSFNRYQPRINGFSEKRPDAVVISGRTGRVEELLQAGDDLPAEAVLLSPHTTDNDSGLREMASNALKFDIGALLRLRTFVYLLAGTVLFLFQTHNTLTIISLAEQNEKLREQIQMSSSVITAQELKAHELHSIHNIAQDAVSLGLVASRVPAVELEQ